MNTGSVPQGFPGNLIKETIAIGMSYGVDIQLHIRYALAVNNLFVEMANEISTLLQRQLNKITD